jgi:hypothetical protein
VDDFYYVLFCVAGVVQALHSSITTTLQEWMAFWQFCVSSCCSPKADGCLVIRRHDDINEDRDWGMRLEHLASTVVEVDCLQTGKSAEFEGKVTVRRRQMPLSYMVDVDSKFPGALGISSGFYSVADAVGVSARYFPMM